MGKRLEAASRIRDAAVKKIQAEGQLEETGNFGPVLQWRAPDWREGGIHIIHRTPFQRIPKPSAKYRKAVVEYGLERSKNLLPYGLDIWCDRKVFNIEWNDAGEVRLVSFKRGSWEETVLSWGEEQPAARV